ncbi:uncharacterized protein SCODWIG_02854 [Saccharomycodes ludwigii]|uniref:HMG box domain-containing protein n=1 Tax=Saccharomycodes ludwigii TaxID=36035 RepID=A0A376B8S0_9ASCO|nr:hypothetical protein SCDLUD_005270 [Saccharomycodes ludwigii]KAH3898924.1 hypothetical protein SCDLUD_005270 [Saccharomycodes ludwigii]SSD61093.1 uncharacterized protein SCODWIG_02854 [Saccharomycodes ludwigii]
MSLSDHELDQSKGEHFPEFLSNGSNSHDPSNPNIKDDPDTLVDPSANNNTNHNLHNHNNHHLHNAVAQIEHNNNNVNNDGHSDSSGANNVHNLNNNTIAAVAAATNNGNIAITEAMFNSFLIQISQRQVPNVLAQQTPAVTSAVSSAALNAIKHQQQNYSTTVAANNNSRQFHSNAPQYLDPTNQAFMQQSKFLNKSSRKSQAAAAASVEPVKKLSISQQRVEKRKQLIKMGPKRPSSAYFLYYQGIRETLKKEHPQLKVPDLSKLAAEKWKAMNEDEKKPFQDKVADQWISYRAQKKLYEADLPPKKPSGPFVQFHKDIKQELLKEHPGKNLLELTKFASVKWKETSEETRKKYTESYKEQMKKWKDAHDEYEKNHPETS